MDGSILSTNYSTQDYLDVNVKDGTMVEQAATGQYAIHEFKDFIGILGSVIVDYWGQSTLAPSISPVYLQIYNQNSTTWEQIDSDSTTGANTDFELTANIADTTNYRSAGIITCRVYQLSV